MGGSRGCCKGCFAAMAESRGWITLDPGLVHGGPGKHLVGNSALALSVQLEAGRGECLRGGHAWPVGGGWRACGWPGSLEDVPKPWGLVGDRAECLISQCYVHRVSLQLHHGIEPLGATDSPNIYIAINVNPLTG